MRQRPSAASMSGGIGYDAPMSQRPSTGSSQDYYGGYRGGPVLGSPMGKQSQHGNGGVGYGGPPPGQPMQRFSSSGSAGSNNGSSHYRSHTTVHTNKESYGLHNFKMLLFFLMVLWSIAIVPMWWRVRGKVGTILTDLKKPNTNSIKELYSNLLQELNNVQRDRAKKIREKTNELSAKERELKKENIQLTKERESLKVVHDDGKEQQLILREEAFEDHVWNLEDAIRKESRRIVMERFGPGPHEVEFRFFIEGTERSFVVQMAPIDEVPHAVHLFLEQVEHGLLNGCFFYLNGPHVVQAGPQLAVNGEDRSQYLAPFKAAGLDVLSFPDYSEEFPHTELTLGYTGRPGGIDWYINKIDNSVVHGPGGQTRYALEEYGDPCFGKIVRGQDHAAVLFQQPVYGDGTAIQYFLPNPIRIQQARILTQRPPSAADIAEAIQESQTQGGRSERPDVPIMEHAVEA